MKIHISIFNYEREDMLHIILDEIDAFLDAQTDITIDYTIIDDGSSYVHPKMVKFEHGGKAEYWKRWDYTLKSLKDTDYDAYIFIPNDIMKIDFETIVKYIKDYKDKPYVLNITTDDRTTCWNTRQMIRINGSINKVFFTDCGFICSYAALEALDFRMKTIDPNRFSKPNISSGVGQQLTQRFNDKDVPIFMPTYSLSYHGTHLSLMHPNERKHNPLVSKYKENHKIYKIVIGVATMNTRKGSLAKMIESLENQTIKLDKIIIYNNDDNDFNATDNGKFYFFETEVDDNTYFFSMDDDIFYAPTYIEDMIAAIDRLGTIVTHHGRQLLGLDKHYYSGHKGFSCLFRNNFEGIIDVAGTGVTAFHTSYFKPKGIFESEYKRMSDCVFSLEAAKEGKLITVLKHPTGYIKDICDDNINSCFTNENKQPFNQIQICNQIIKIKDNNNG